MNVSRKLALAGTTLLLVAGLTACDNPGPAESAGKKIDQTAVAAGQSINDAAEKVGDKINEQGAKASVAIDDSEITAKIKAAIFAEPGLKTLQINVDTIKGNVTLSGTVDSQASGERVRILASAVTGVRDVRNNLVDKSVKTN